MSQPRVRAYHPNHPLNTLPVLITIVRERDLVILIVLLAQVQLDARAFEDPLRLAGGFVHYGWDAAVGWKVVSYVVPCCLHRKEKILCDEAGDIVAYG